MKTYLRLSALIFLVIGVISTLMITGTLGSLTSLYYKEVSFIKVSPSVTWAVAAVSYLLFLFGFGLSWSVARRDRQIRKREAELSALIEILQDGRTQQLAVLGMLRETAEATSNKNEKHAPEREPSGSKRSTS